MNWLPRRRRAVRAALIRYGFVAFMTSVFLGFVWFGLFIAAEKGW